ncbi:uncharacterized protein LOC142351203 isoform X1 [Convolutriloba macropyga]|uniref:uncharacterized protein LOC142351203 isoform X1 n=1 Tax=Convolutriloba macropyga TaxID=536237 RepID=UPI003F525DCE
MSFNSQALKELSDISERVKHNVPYATVESYHGNVLFVSISRTQRVTLDCTILFTDDYPQSPLIIQLKSKTLADELLKGLVKLLDENCKKFIGQYQVVPQMKFLSDYLTENIFCCCFDEFQKIKREICSKWVELKPKQKKGIAHFKITCRGHESQVKLTVPLNYPTEAVSIDIKEFQSTLPEYLTSPILKQAVEEARKCVEPPLNVKVLKGKPFEIRPSFYHVAKFLILDSLLMFKQTNCRLCSEPAFPDKPEDVRAYNRDPMYVERVYCGHIFHFGCLHKLINTPPFNENKQCPVCKLTIYHERWKETPQVLADRWAHKQAKQRELEEVIDFLQ